MIYKTTKNIFLLFIPFVLTACSKSDTKEFLFGSNNGPDPFVIGSTLSPLKMNKYSTISELPKPKPALPPSQMPSHAKKASDILNIKKEDVNSVLEEKTIDFHAFDTEMQKQYQNQEENGYLLSKILGKKEIVDPTVREEILKK